jgi:hypothetical protein
LLAILIHRHIGGLEATMFLNLDKKFQSLRKIQYKILLQARSFVGVFKLSFNPLKCLLTFPISVLMPFRSLCYNSLMFVIGVILLGALWGLLLLVVGVRASIKARRENIKDLKECGWLD